MARDGFFETYFAFVEGFFDGAFRDAVLIADEGAGLVRKQRGHKLALHIVVEGAVLIDETDTFFCHILSENRVIVLQVSDFVRFNGRTHIPFDAAGAATLRQIAAEAILNQFI